MISLLFEILVFKSKSVWLFGLMIGMFLILLRLFIDDLSGFKIVIKMEEE